MEKYLICFLILLSNSILSQNIKVVDEFDDPIYNVGFYNKEQTILKFSNFKGEINLSDFNSNDSIFIQHPSFNDKIIFKNIINQNKIKLESKIINIDEIIFSVNKWEESINEVTNKAVIFSEKKINEIAPQTSADLLEKSGEIFVQKSQLGGGSPMIRGFSANRILLTLDGIRLNNIIYRSGNLHNIIGIDPNILEGVEVLFGPASVIYGSDALGGAINFKIKDPKFNSNKTIFFNSQKIQYNSSSNSKHYSINFGINSKKIGTITSFSFNAFQNLKSGKKRNKFYKDFGYRDEYVIRDYINNEDKIINNNNPNIQKFTGYSQLDFINKINFKLSNKTNLIHGIYLSKSSNIPRYDRLILYKDIFTPKYSEWYYGPNLFLMNKIELNNFRKTKYYDAFKLNISNQIIKESRHSRVFNSNFLNNRNEKVDIISLNLDLDKKFKNDEIFYGYEFIYNNVNSEANKINIISNESSKISTRYPDNGTQFLSNSLYFSYKKKFRKIFSNVGLRGNISRLESKLSNQILEFPFSEINLNTSSVSGNIGFRYNYNKSSFKVQYSNGFRSPNLDDLGKIFDSEPGNIIIPNADLEPEYVNNYELNYEFKSDKIILKNTFFYIRLNNAIIRTDSKFNGKDSIIYDGVLSKVQQLNNGAKAYVYGFSNLFNFKLNESVNIEHTISFNNSKDKINNRPLRHSSPLFGRLSLNYSKRKIKLGYNISYNGKKKLINFSPSELNKLYLYTQYGSPAWITHNLFFKLNYNYFINFDFGIDNIFDKHYRTYSSGISAPGRNIRFGVNLKF
ncbi:MAG: hypothetical protein CL870_04670 [Cytophagia bacterium]|nr:hypothetical protein [Cytophagia bacterium]